MSTPLQTFLQQHQLTTAAPVLANYAALLRQWTPKINLIAPSTVAQLETRHILDSAQVYPLLTEALNSMHVAPNAAANVLDVGSGAGLPGLILAILAQSANNSCHITVAERDQRKAAFLVTARHQLGLNNVTVHAGDVLELTHQPKRFAIITGRAFTETSRFVEMTKPLLTPGGQWLLLKGQAVSQEISALEPMTMTQTPSITDPTGWIVSLKPKA